MDGCGARARTRPAPIGERRVLGAATWALTALCALRVAGQVLVVVSGVGWWPAAQHRESGLLPYPALLSAQAVILVALVSVDGQAWRGAGWLMAPRPDSRAGCGGSATRTPAR